MRRVGFASATSRLRQEIRRDYSDEEISKYETDQDSGLRYLVGVKVGQFAYPIHILEEVISEEIYRRFDDDDTILEALACLQAAIIDNHWISYGFKSQEIEKEDLYPLDEGSEVLPFEKWSTYTGLITPFIFPQSGESEKQFLLRQKTASREILTNLNENKISDIKSVPVHGFFRHKQHEPKTYYRQTAFLLFPSGLKNRRMNAREYMFHIVEFWNFMRFLNNVHHQKSVAIIRNGYMYQIDGDCREPLFNEISRITVNGV